VKNTTAGEDVRDFVAKKHHLAMVGVAATLGVYAMASTLYFLLDSPELIRAIMSVTFGTAITILFYSYSRINFMYRDLMTDTLRRELFEQKVREVTRRGQRVTIAIIDVNWLKVTNDTLGHDAGDRVIKELARRLLVKYSKRVNRDTMVARLGGDEFAVVSTGNDSPERLAADLTRIISEPFRDYADDGDRRRLYLEMQNRELIEPGQEWGLAVGGVACSPEGHAAYAKTCADIALYRAKKARKHGPAQCVAFDVVLDSDPAQARALEAALTPQRQGRRLRDYSPTWIN
jgi:diguanylate cyclase (GGDEF)-like protein